MNANLIADVAEYLGVEKPYEIRISSKPHDWAAGFCEQRMRKGKIIKHVITLYLPSIIASGFSLESVIAHELIHAWQAEEGILLEGQYHGEDFAYAAADVEQTFGIDEVYDPENDTE